MNNMLHNDKPRVLITASVASMIDLFNKDNINILLSLGYQVDVAANFQFGNITDDKRTADFKKELLEKGIQVYDIPVPRDIRDVRNICKSYSILYNICKKNKYQIMHCHSPIGGVLARLAFKKIRSPQNICIYTAHGFHFFDGASKKAWLLYYPIEKFCSYFTDVLITINREDYKRAKKMNARKVEYVAGIGVHIENFKNLNINRQQKRAEFGFTDNDFVWMSTGQLSERKNHEVVIRALAKLQDKHIKYIIVGFGELEQSLKLLAKKLKVSEQIVFAGYRSDVNELLNAVDAFVFPSLQEGLPVALMEAMASGLPCIASKIRGNTDLLSVQKECLFDCRDVSELSRKIYEITYNRKKRTILTEINKKHILLFDDNHVKKVMQKIYLDCVKRKKDDI